MNCHSNIKWTLFSDLSFEYVIEKLDFQRRKAEATVKQKALITLIRSYKGHEILTPERVHKVFTFFPDVSDYSWLPFADQLG